MAGRFEFGEGSEIRVLVVSVDPEVDEHPVRPVHLRRSERLAGNGHDAGAVLARALGDELFDPGGEGGQRRRGRERGLVTSGSSEFTEDGTEAKRLVLMRVAAIPAAASSICLRSTPMSAAGTRPNMVNAE
jgi:hypothetical protein